MSDRLAPPSDSAAPGTAAVPGGEVDLVVLAAEVCRRYDAEFPDERERYGPAGMAWCRHDTQHLLAWAVADAHGGFVDLLEQVAWLARVLAAREFPVARLARDLELAADVVAERLGDDAIRARLAQAAGSLA